MKNYTDIEQSKKLAEILPIESADMYWYLATKGNPKVMFNEGYNEYGDFELPCWSLAALLSVLPVIIGDVLSKNSLRLRIDKSETNFNVWYDNLDSGMVEEGLDIIKSNAVDACYEMIIKLHELKML